MPISPTTGSEPSSADLSNQTITSILSVTAGKQSPSRARSKTSVPSKRPANFSLKMSQCLNWSKRPLMWLVTAMLIMTLARGQEASAWHFNSDGLPGIITMPDSQPGGSFPAQPFGDANDRQRASDANNNNHLFQPGANLFTNGFLSSRAALNQLLASSQPQPQPQQQQQHFLMPSTTANQVVNGHAGSPTSSLTNSFGGYSPIRVISESNEVVPNQHVARAPVDATTVAAPWASLQASDVVKAATVAADSTRESSSGSPSDSLTENVPPPSATQSPTKSDNQAHSEDERVARDATQLKPSPLGKILETVSRAEPWLQPLAGLKDQLNQTALKKAAQQISAGDVAASQVEASPTPAPAISTTITTTSTTSTTKPPPARQDQQQSRAASVAEHQLKPMRHGAHNRDPLKTAEQQIINQHARAHQRYETATVSPASQPPQVRLLPNKLRDNKLLNSFLSLALSGDHNSAPDRYSSSSSLSSSNSADGQQRQKSGLWTAMVDDLKSGISSRSSIVKAAMSDNKLARTLSTVGKTIGGNKYVAGAGIAAALAALGLTVSKLFVSPYSGTLVSPYSKQSFGGYGDQMMPSSSMIRPSFTQGDTRIPTFTEGGPISDLMIAAANSQAYEQAHHPQAMSVSSNDALHYGGPTGDSFQPGRTQGAIVDSANGHYSSYYAKQPAQEATAQGDTYYNLQPNSYAMDTRLMQVYRPQQLAPQQEPKDPHQFGSYVSGTPSPYSGVQYTVPPPSAYEPGPQPYAHSPQSNYDLQPPATVPNNYDQHSSDQMAVASEVQTSEVPQRWSGYSMMSSPHRSGSVKLKLDDRTRGLLQQQLQATEFARPRPVLERLVAFRDQPVADQSNSMEFVLGNDGSPKSGRLADDSMTSRNEHKGQTSRQMSKQQNVISQPQKTTSGDVGEPFRAGPLQTSRIEAARSSRPRPVAYLTLAPNSSQTQWHATVANPSVANGQSQQNLLSDGPGKLPAQQATNWQWQSSRMAPTVDTAPSRSSSQSSSPESSTRQDHKFRMNGGGWQSVNVAAKQQQQQQQALLHSRPLDSSSSFGEKNSLSPTTNESDSLVEATTLEKDNNNNSQAATSDSQDQLLQTTADRSTRVSRTPSTKESRAIPQAASDGNHGIHIMTDSRLTDGRSQQSSTANRWPQEMARLESGRLEGGSQSSWRRNEELLQAASSTGTNLIQLSPATAAAGNGGAAEYQIESLSFNLESNNSGGGGGGGGGGSSANGNQLVSTATDKATMPTNKLIEAKANPNANNAETSVSIKPIVTVARPLASPTQHDQLDWRADGDKPAGQRPQDEDNAAEPLSGDNDGDKQSSGTAADGGGSPASVVAGGGRGQSQHTADDNETETTGEPGHKQRAFRGLVAGSISAS